MGLVRRASARGRAALFFLALAGAGAGGALAISGCGPRAVATVNGQSLGENDFLRLCETSSQITQDQGTVGLQVLLQWVQSTLRAQEARKLGVYPTEAELEARIGIFRNRARALGSTFEDQLARRGMTFATFKRELVDALVAEKILFNGVNVSEAQIREIYEKGKKQNTVPEQAEISQITVDSEPALKQVVSDLNSNVAFELVAQTRSKDGFAQRAGKVGVVTERASPDQRVAPEVVKAAFKLKEGQHSDPIKVGATWVVVRLDRKIPPKEPSLDETREQIRMELLQQEGQKSGKVQQNQLQMAEVVARADVHVNRPEYQQPVQSFLNDMKSRPGTVPGGAQRPPGAGGAGAPPGGAGGSGQPGATPGAGAPPGGAPGGPGAGGSDLPPPPPR